MPSHTVPPPPSFHQSPDHVSAAFFIAGFSNGFDGSPGMRIEPPCQLTGIRIEGREITADGKLRAATR